MVFSLLLLGGGYDGVQAQVEDSYVFEDESYNSSFSGPLTFCVRKDSAAAFASADGGTQPVICDNEGKLYTTSAGGSGGAVTNAGTFVVQEDGAALTALEKIDDFISGSEGQVDIITSALPTGASTSAKQLADGHNVTVDNASIAVTGTFFQGTQPVSGTFFQGTQPVSGTVTAAINAGLFHANSPVTEVAILTIIDGSADSDVLTTNLGKSSAITITGSGRITKICLIVEGTAPFSEDGTIYFFDADPSITSNTADMTVAEAITVVSMISLKGTDYNDNFATIKINCQAADESFHAITHVVYEQEGSTTIANQDFRLHIWYERRS